MTKSVLVGTAVLASLIGGCSNQTPEPAAPGTADPAPSAAPADPSAAPPDPAAAPAESAAPASADPPIYASKTTDSIEAKAGSKFVVALPANITTPTKWFVVPETSPTVKMLERKYVDKPPEGCKDCAGYGGTDFWTFEATAAGEVELDFQLRPLSNKPGAKPYESKKIKIVVK